MKAAICYEFGQPLVIEEIVIDAPQAGELKVKLSACAICHSDIHYMEGAWGGTLPAVYGHEAAGIVEEVGVGVATVAPGDHVIVSLLRSCGKCHFCERNESYMCEAKFALDSETRLHTTDGKPIHQGLRTGAFAEAVVVEQSQVVPIPADVSFDSASLLACGVITGARRSRQHGKGRARKQRHRDRYGRRRAQQRPGRPCAPAPIRSSRSTCLTPNSRQPRHLAPHTPSIR